MSGKNVAASVRQRLLNFSRKGGEDFQLLLTRYAIECLLYRIGESEHATRFVLSSRQQRLRIFRGRARQGDRGGLQPRSTNSPSLSREG